MRSRIETPPTKGMMVGGSTKRAPVCGLTRAGSVATLLGTSSEVPEDAHRLAVPCRDEAPVGPHTVGGASVDECGSPAVSGAMTVL